MASTSVMVGENAGAMDARSHPSAVPLSGSFGLCLPAVAQILPKRLAASLSVNASRSRPALFVAICFLFGVIVPVEIAADSEMFVSRTILRVPPHFAITAFTIAVAMLADLGYYQKLITRPSVAFGLSILAFVTVVGAWRHGTGSQLFRSDIYIIRWFFVGFILMRSAIAAGMLRQYLVFAAIVIIATAYSIDVTNTQEGQIDTATKRVTSSNLWPVINCGTIMIGLLVTVTWPRSSRYAAVSAAAFAAIVFIGSIRTSTRSLFAEQMLCLVLGLLALSRDPRMKGRGRTVQRAATLMAVIGAIGLAYQIVGGNLLSSYSQIGTRMEGTLRESRVGAARIDEAAEFLRGMRPDEWILGGGLGQMFYSILGAWTNVPHIAVIGWLQKGGLGVMFLVLLTVYILPGVGFVQQLLRPRRWSPLPAPILVVGPMMVSWCALTFVSGGLDIGCFLALGGLTALWIQLADDDAVFTVIRLRPYRPHEPRRPEFIGVGPAGQMGAVAR